MQAIRWKQFPFLPIQAASILNPVLIRKDDVKRQVTGLAVGVTVVRLTRLAATIRTIINIKHSQDYRAIRFFLKILSIMAGLLPPPSPVVIMSGLT